MKIDSTDPIFMVGMARSGTSIISEAISLHEDLGWISNYVQRFPACAGLAALNRIGDIPFVGRSLRGKKKQSKGLATTIRRCLPYATEAYPFWNRCLGEKFGWTYLAGERATRGEKEAARKAVRTVLRFQGKIRLFAKFTGPPRIQFLSSVFPEAFFIQIIRDPRAVVSSLLQVPFWREGGGLDKPWWNGLPQKDLQQWEEQGKTPAGLAAIQWKRVIELGMEEKGLTIPGQYLEFRYEDFVCQAHECLTRVFAWAGLSDSAQAHDYLANEGRLVNKNHKFKRALSTDDLSVIKRITGDLARNYGYDLD